MVFTAFLPVLSRVTSKSISCPDSLVTGSSFWTLEMDVGELKDTLTRPAPGSAKTSAVGVVAAGPAVLATVCSTEEGGDLGLKEALQAPGRKTRQPPM